MKSYAICPISNKTINERVARVNAALTVFLLLLFVLSGSVYLILFLAIDFLMRATDYSKYSVLAILSNNIAGYFSLETLLINAGPKIFASRIGFVLSSLIILSHIFEASWLALGIIGILGLFSFLEAAFGICVACEIYPFFYRLLYHQGFKE